MKLHYCKILLFSISLNILLSSSYEHNKNKPYTIPLTPTTTSRVLSECDIQTSIYDNDPEMKGVMQDFNRQTSQRFEEYEKRMIKNRQKYKEQCHKDIEEIIVKDKIDKSLTEKVEKGCLRCGCGLGGVAAGVGIFGALGTYGWKVAATATAYETAKQAGIEAGIKAVIAEIKGSSFINQCLVVDWLKFINESNYNSIPDLFNAVNSVVTANGEKCQVVTGNIGRVYNGLSEKDAWFPSFVKKGTETATAITESVETTELAKVEAASTHSYTAIGYSVTAILIIVLVMVIIYLILRYRRKKKMNKKTQYTKLLNQ
ncbi:PIR protein, putative [Plasmodium sp. gorilla clade G1]|nr:PIR protein, putative [Plasmodium sp. gorilla clade G1]